jgi:hypothetical protein
MGFRGPEVQILSSRPVKKTRRLEVCKEHLQASFFVDSCPRTTLYGGITKHILMERL